jgi:hypothetical protein
MPFPLGLAALAVHAAPLVPWAWGINGFASVLATLLATLLAIHWGYAAVLLLAAACYGLAAWQFPQQGQALRQTLASQGCSAQGRPGGR